MIAACEPINLAFKKAERNLSADLIKYRSRMANGYYGKVPMAGTFPTGRGTSIIGLRYPRIGMNLPQWRGVVDEVCETNLCDNPTQEMIHNGHPEEYNWSIQRTALQSDWLCLQSLLYREDAAAQIAHFEDGIKDRTAWVWDEKLRAEYLHNCENHLMAKVPQSVLDDNDCDCWVGDCDSEMITDAWHFEMYPDDGNIPGQVNPNYIRVNCDPAELDLIAMTSTDMFEDARLKLEWDDENSPAIGEGIDLLDVVLSDKRIGTDLIEQEDIAMNNAMSYGGFETSMLKRTLGTKFVLRNAFSFRYDLYAARFYPDTAFNADLAAFDTADPTTWPRFFRVYPYRPATNPLGGIRWIPNEYYQRAPFGINTIFTPKVISYQGLPSPTSVGSARDGGVVNYGGDARWVNPDWQCNVDRDKGFWRILMGCAVKPDRPEFGYAWLVRLKRNISLRANCCPLPSTPCFEDINPYCWENGNDNPNAEPGETFGQNRVIAWNGAF